MFTEETEPENQRMENRYEELKMIMESTIEVKYHGNGVFMLKAQDGNYWNSVFDELRRHDFEVQKNLDNTLYVETSSQDPRR